MLVDLRERYLREYDTEVAASDSLRTLSQSVTGQALALSQVNGAWMLEYAHHIDQGKMQSAFRTPLPVLQVNPTMTALSTRIPARALITVFGSDLAGWYRYIRSAAPQIAERI